MVSILDRQGDEPTGTAGDVPGQRPSEVSGVGSAVWIRRDDLGGFVLVGGGLERLCRVSSAGSHGFHVSVFEELGPVERVVWACSQASRRLSDSGLEMK
jgi:hypothetical protein